MKAQSPLQNESNDTEVLLGVVGRSAKLVAAAKQVHLMAGSDAPCLLLGETGTGKELFARAMHYLSPRRDSPFVPLNCGAVADHLFENELFGHARGAYTDARSQENGLLAYAEDGTLFLDEIDALSSSSQVKLLRVLQEREYRPLGSARSVVTNVRILAACNCDVWQRVQARLFREDLYHRLNVLRLVIPPLRERIDDIPLLVRHFLREFSAREGRGKVEVTDAAMVRLTAYRWSGNVRELQGLLHRAFLLHVGPVLDADSLDVPEVQSVQDHSGLLSASDSPQTLKAAKDRAVQQCEQTYLAEVLRRCEGNVSRAARASGKERRSFQRLLRKHKFDRSNLSPRTTI
jgi:transcriptional regulator with GAF, ATPase, and Fis domain